VMFWGGVLPTQKTEGTSVISLWVTVHLIWSKQCSYYLISDTLQWAEFFSSSLQFSGILHPSKLNMDTCVAVRLWRGRDKGGKANWQTPGYPGPSWLVLVLSGCYNKIP
jgi:hypothetical protein